VEQGRDEDVMVVSVHAHLCKDGDSMALIASLHGIEKLAFTVGEKAAGEGEIEGVNAGPKGMQNLPRPVKRSSQ
jgi:hypothetical protein